ncbi:MAG: hypothetical protein ACLFQW_04200 [Spirochaetaceae bacterium]
MKIKNSLVLFVVASTTCFVSCGPSSGDSFSHAPVQQTLGVKRGNLFITEKITG